MSSLKAIGIFDSGIGGMTVLKECVKLLPNENFIYFGDIARAPYGNKDKAEIIRYAKEIMHFMYKKNVKAVVVACNTESAYALDIIREDYPEIPIIGVIEPAIYRANVISVNKNIAVLATNATVSSHAYSNYAAKNYGYDILEIPCPSLVPLIEKGITSYEDISEALENDIKEKKFDNIDTIILGCTHYPLVEEEISKYFKDKILVNPAKDTSKELYNELKKRELLNNQKNSNIISIYSSADSKMLKKLGDRISKGIKINIIESLI